MAFEFIQRKFDNYVSEQANTLFENACVELMCQTLTSPLAVSVYMSLYPEKHIVDAVIERTKDLFSHAGMHAEIHARTETPTGPHRIFLQRVRYQRDSGNE